MQWIRDASDRDNASVSMHSWECTSKRHLRRRFKWWRRNASDFETMTQTIPMLINVTTSGFSVVILKVMLPVEAWKWSGHSSYCSNRQRESFVWENRSGQLDSHLRCRRVRDKWRRWHTVQELIERNSKLSANTAFRSVDTAHVPSLNLLPKLRNSFSWVHPVFCTTSSTE